MGPAGPGLEDAPIVADVNWPHGRRINLDEALQRLQGGLNFSLSDLLEDRIVRAQPQVFQVWVEPIGPVQARVVQRPIFTLAGRLQLGRRNGQWRMDQGQERMIPAGARVLIRIHMGHLFDQGGRQFSAALDALLDRRTVHVPGGVFESWFFVEA